jgi:hypothetical protein
MGGKTSKSTQTVSIPPEVLARYNSVNARAESAANTPFKQYGGEFVAGLTGAQRSGISNINAAANMAQPYFGAAGEAYGAGLNQGQGYLGEATGYARAGGQNVNASDINGEAINKYMSPYLQSVLQGTAGLLNQQNQQAMSGQTGNAIRQGAFGGDRGGIAAANLQQQQRLADSSIFSNILNQGYNNALSTAVGQQGVNLAAQQANRAATQATADRIAGLGQQGFNQYTTTGQNVQGLGAAAQNAAIQGGQAQMGAGAVEQATNQALDTAKYNQFKEEQSYPFQTAQFLSNIAQGTGALSGSTTTTAQPGGFFSDARLKENIEKVGKTYDGQHIYRYNYKGDPTTQIGLIAQEVEKHHPDAVGSSNHYRTVDYDKATDHAADRGHFYAGGLASMGGGVGPMQAGQGFAEGGLAGYDPTYMAELYKQLYAAGTGHGINGMQGIPVTPAEIHELMVAKGLQGGPEGNRVADAVNAIESVGQLGNTLGAWDYGKKPKASERYPMDERIGHALGGAMPYANTDSIVPQQDAQQHQLMTAQGIGGGGNGTGKAIGQIAGLASSLIPGGGIVKKGLGVIGKLFSDERMKENIRPIGELFDGQKVHSFNYKGDPRTQIGLIAQEVEHHSPHAVDHDHGMKTVDYHDATQHAAHRGHFAEGGMPEEMEEGSPEIVSPGLMAIRRKLNPLGVKTAGFSDRLAQDRYSDLWNLDDHHKGLGAADAMPPPAENMLERKPALTRLVDVKRDTQRTAPTTPGLAPNLSGKASSKGLDSEVVKFFVDKGLSEDQSRGIAAGIMAESGGNHMAVNPTSGALGLGQWLGPRKKEAIRKYGANPSKGEQLEHLWSELTGGDVGGPKVLAQKDAHSVLHSYINDFMRPAKGRETEGDISRGYAALREHHAAGGLAGRYGYEGGGTPTEVEIAAEEERRKRLPLSEDVRALAEAENLPVQTISQAPEYKGASAETSPSGLSGAAMQSDLAAPAPTSAAPDYVNGALPAEVNKLSAGLSGGKPQSEQGKAKVPYDSKTNNKFFPRLFHGETDAVLSALKGIAAMGAAPTRSLGVALATGLGAGAEAYQGQRQFGLEQKKTAAQEMQARATEQQALNGAVEAKSAWQGAMNQGSTALQNWISYANSKIQGLAAVGKKDEKLNSLYDAAVEKMRGFNLNGEMPTAGLAIPGSNAPTPAGGLVTPPAAGSAGETPSPAKGPVTMGAVDYNASEAKLRSQAIALAAAGQPEIANQINEYVSKAYPAEAKGTEALEAARSGALGLTDLGLKAETANKTLVTLKEFEEALNRVPGAFQGPLSEAGIKYGTTLNQLGEAFGIGPIFDPKKIGSAEEAQKQANRLRDALVSSFNGTAGSEVLQSFVGSSPSLMNSEEGARRLISGVRQANAATNAEYAFGVGFKGNPRQRSIEFRNKYPPEYWVKRSKADFEFSQPDKKNIVDSIKKDPSMQFKIGNMTARQYYDKYYRGIGGAAGVFNLVNGM